MLCVFSKTTLAQVPVSNTETPPPVAIPSTAPMNSIDNPDQAAIDQAHALQSQAMSMLSVFTADGKPVSNPMELLQSPEFQERLKQLGELQKMLENPAVRKYVRVVTNSEVVSSLRAVVDKPKEKHMHLLFAELGFFVVFALFRTWFLARKAGFFKKILWSTGLFAVWMFGISFVLPTVTLGWEYPAFLGSVWRAFLSA